MATISPNNIEYQLAHINDDKSVTLVTSLTISLVLAVAAVVLRFISRRLCKAKIQADDFLIVVALVRVIAQLAIPLDEFNW